MHVSFGSDARRGTRVPPGRSDSAQHERTQPSLPCRIAQDRAQQQQEQSEETQRHGNRVHLGDGRSKRVKHNQVERTAAQPAQATIPPTSAIAAPAIAGAHQVSASDVRGIATPTATISKPTTLSTIPAPRFNR